MPNFICVSLWDIKPPNLLVEQEAVWLSSRQALLDAQWERLFGDSDANNHY